MVVFTMAIPPFGDKATFYTTRVAERTIALSKVVVRSPVSIDKALSAREKATERTLDVSRLRNPSGEFGSGCR